MKRHAENRVRMAVDDDGAVRPLDEDLAEMRGNAEPAADFLAREDAARERAMKRMPSMSVGGHKSVPWDPSLGGVA